ncbi:hypothetical protein [Amycolatopsis sp. H20-H5]|uniref:hypothetical protein n=1 Tax=Amycolatopsis sp. H20-H5 TaxID=3046309 RepID=UPI002DBDFEAE|nr:hypothetical protein [Amycolatopsis sp. H20-H5]MEC3980314.1 hypothetical protein [Amycolatopsis sp. H20-H5]
MKFFSRAAAVCASVLALGGVLVPAADAATPSTYGDFSMMFKQSAGQFKPSDGSAFQWTWAPKSATESWVAWGDPKTWPPAGSEHFLRAGDWVLLDGWSGNGTYYSQRVTSESSCDGAGANCAAIPSDGGRQHYVRWNVPTSNYRLKAVGTITEQSSGKVIDFSHTQTWGAPHACHNARHPAQTCITQSEAWADNNGLPTGSPIRETLRRDIQIAAGLGVAFTIDQQVPSPWHAEGTDYWMWT